MAESLPTTKKKLIKRTVVEETYEEVNENNPTDSGKPSVEKRITGELGEASLSPLFDI